MSWWHTLCRVAKRVSRLRCWLSENSGQDLLEYVILGAFVALVALAGAGNLGESVNSWFGSTSEAVGDAERKSNCSARGMASSNGKCNGG